ncbi:hypothetical protein ACIBCN_18755 [Nocardia sp. NPDC051052]|uniref:hypothetical protein n=1 Tax=Nocardia sp. NPDC051052 TaxID=3364322 RepID=UPI0037BB6605
MTAGARRPRGGRPTLTDADKQHIVTLHGQGKGRNEIAAELGVNPRTITYWAEKLKLRFDATQTAAATAARLEQLKAQRIGMAEQLAAKLPVLHDRMWQTHTTYERGTGPSGAPILIPVTLPLPPLRDVREGYTAYSMALRSFTELIDSQANETVASDRSMLGDLFGRLKDAVDTDRAGGEPTPP